MVQAAVLDGLFLDLFSPFDDGSVTPVVSVGGCDVTNALVVWRIKEKLRWVRAAETRQVARWRITHFLRHAREKIGDNPVFGKLRKAVETIDKQLERILERWTSTYSNARK